MKRRSTNPPLPRFALPPEQIEKLPDELPASPVSPTSRKLTDQLENFRDDEAPENVARRRRRYSSFWRHDPYLAAVIFGAPEEHAQIPSEVSETSASVSLSQLEVHPRGRRRSRRYPRRNRGQHRYITPPNVLEGVPYVSVRRIREEAGVDGENSGDETAEEVSAGQPGNLDAEPANHTGNELADPDQAETEQEDWLALFTNLTDEPATQPGNGSAPPPAGNAATGAGGRRIWVRQGRRLVRTRSS